MTTHIRIEVDVKKRLERIASIENVTLKRTLENAITIYEIELYRRFNNGERLSPKVLKKVVELREWLRVEHKRQYKKLVEKSNVRE